MEETKQNVYGYAVKTTLGTEIVFTSKDDLISYLRGALCGHFDISIKNILVEKHFGA